MLNSDISNHLKPIVEDLGYELWGVERISSGRRSLLRIYIDSANGIGIEDCEKVSRQVSAWLDVEDPIAGNYSLEISSPGIPRPLFYPEQFQRYIGMDVQVKLYQLIDNKRKISGIIKGCNENSVSLLVGEQLYQIDYANIVKAYLMVE